MTLINTGLGLLTQADAYIVRYLCKKGIHKNTQKCTKIHKNTQKYTKIHKNYETLKSACENLFVILCNKHNFVSNYQGVMSVKDYTDKKYYKNVKD